MWLNQAELSILKMKFYKGCYLFVYFPTLSQVTHSYLYMDMTITELIEIELFNVMHTD